MVSLGIVISGNRIEGGSEFFFQQICEAVNIDSPGSVIPYLKATGLLDCGMPLVTKRPAAHRKQIGLFRNDAAGPALRLMPGS
jgi:hypothetical protein